MKIFRFAFLTLAVVALHLTTGCTQTISGKGPKVTKELKLSSFQSIGLGVQGTVYITKGPQKVTIEGQENIIELIETEVENGSWNIGFPKFTKVRNYEALVINITMPSVEKLAIGGSGKIIGKDAFPGLGSLKISIAGSGTIEFSGSAEEAEINIAGSGDILTGGLAVNTCQVSIAGSGDAFVDVNNDLKVSIAGSGKVKYKGTPRIKTSIAGSGNVSSMD